MNSLHVYFFKSFGALIVASKTPQANMKSKSFFLLFILSFLSIGMQTADAKTGRYRLTWRDDPATTMVIGWDQMSGHSGKVYFDVVNHGSVPDKFAFSKIPENIVSAKGMSNHFVRLGGLRPNTTYYFLIADNEEISQVFSFRTAPDRSTDRLSIIAGSDSRNHRKARVDANKMVSKLRPHVVVFGGDFTENDSGQEWVEWFDDWQSTISKDGRMYPVLVARGNHEFSNESLVSLFDLKSPTITYAQSLGGDLLRIYTLNSMIAPGGDQKAWLQRDLAAHPHISWKMVQYHLPTRPHSVSKEDRNDQYTNWSTLFQEYGIQLAIESDAHVMKSTYPIRPFSGSGSDQGFIRDDETGTVYIGEGCWGAPLRQNNDEKSWTRASGSFNAFHWIFLDEEKIEIRFVKTDGADYVADINPNNVFELPKGINIWNPPSGDVIVIPKDRVNIFAALQADDEADFEDAESFGFASRGEPEVEVGLEILDFSATRRGDDVVVKWITRNEPGSMQYELQRSADNAEYQVVKTVQAKGAEENSYEFVDFNCAAAFPGKFVNYRLKKILPDGKSSIFQPNEQQKRPLANRLDEAIPKLLVDRKNGGNDAKVNYSLTKSGDVLVRLLEQKKGIIRKWELPKQTPGKYSKSFDLSGVPAGKYLLVIKMDDLVIQRFRVLVN